VCQVCGKTWPADQSICPDDGNWLHEETVMEQQRRAVSQGEEQWAPEVTDRHRPYAATAAAGSDDTIPPPTKPRELARGTRVGEYEVESKIGEGAMGEVYRAVHPTIGKRVAIKVMTPRLFDEPESMKRFIAEARAVAAIRHPGIVDVFGFGRLPDNRTYLVMEWLDGSTLGERLQHGTVERDEAIDMLRQIARALEAAHGKGIVHRDLKPDNVFIHHIEDEKPQCKLLDFGLAKVTTKDDQQVARTRTGQLLGTPLYMSPEQCKSKGVDHRTDIYALGCMAYELLCGRVPFDADNAAELISAHLVAEPPKPTKLNPDLTPELETLLLQMLAKDKNQRPTLAEVRRTLSSVLSRPSEAMMAMNPPTGPVPRVMPTGSEPAIVVPPTESQNLAAPPAAEPAPPAVETAVPASERGSLPWPMIAGALVILAIGIALFAFLT
jgi:serine/threonine-protein kinase